MIKDYFNLAFKSLRRRKLRAWLTMLGIFIGIAAVVSLIALGQGMQKAIEDQFFQLGADKVTIQTKGQMAGPITNSDITLKEGDLKAVRKAKGVILATGRLMESVTIDFNKKKKLKLATSIPEDEEEASMVYDAMNVNLKEGRLLKKGDKYKTIISEDYEKPSFNGKGLVLGDKIVIQGETFDIVGILEKTGNPIVDGAFFIKEDALRELVDEPEEYSLLIAQIDNPDQMDLVVNNIRKELRSYRNVDEDKEDFDVQTAADLLGTFSTILSIVQAVLVGIAAISLLVGGIGITNAMFTSVLERKKEIGIMKAIGAKNKDVLWIFLFEAGLLGMTGSVIGLLIGIGLSKLVEIIAFKALGTMLIQAYFPTWLIIGSLAFGFIVGVLAGTVPARQASLLPPVDALRE